MGKQAEQQAETDYSYLDADETQDGLQDIGSDNIKIPFLKIVQALSDAKKKVADAKEGQFWLQGDDFTTDSVDVIPLQFIRCFTRWEPQNERDRKSRRGQFRGAYLPKDAAKMTVKPDFGKWETEDGMFLHETYLYALLIAGREHLGVLRMEFHSTGINDAQMWNRMMKTTFRNDGVRAKMHQQIWRVTSGDRTRDGNDWKGAEFELVGFVAPEQLKISADTKKNAPMSISDESFTALEDHTGNSPTTEGNPKDTPDW